MSTQTSSRVLVLATHDQQRLASVTARLITAARSFNLPVDILVAGSDCQSVADEAAGLADIERVLLADHQALITAGGEDLSALLAPLLQTQYEVLLAPNNTLGRELIPRLAALLDVSPLSDVIRIIEPDLFERPIHAGAALVQVRMRDRKKLMTIRAGRFQPTPSRDEAAAPAQLVMLEQVRASRTSKLIGEEFFWDQPALEIAPIVMGLGRGATSTDLFATIETLAQQLGAVVGGTSTAVEMGMVPNDVLIGQSGKTIAPKLYLALGISGAAQHLAGIRDARVIVAINKDPDAPIFEIADYGLVGDLQIVLPELQKALANNS